MPFLIYPLIGVIAGFGASFFVGSTIKNMLAVVALLAIGYIIFTYSKGK